MQTRNFPIIDGANGVAYPSNAALFGINPVSGSTVTAKTAAYTITTPEIGCAFSNSGASGSVALTLPTPFAGAVLYIFKMTNQTLTLTPAGGTTINTASTLANSSSEAGAAAVVLIGVSATAWITTTKLGTWA